MAKISRDAFAPHPLDRKQPKAGPVDWTQPLELDNGLPVVLLPDDLVPSLYGAHNPDIEGEYWVAQEGLEFRHDLMRRWAFTGDGLKEKYHEAPFTVRNRGSA